MSPGRVALAAAAVAFAVAAGVGPLGACAPDPGDGNAVVVLNTGTRGLDSIVVDPDPPGTSALAARHGYLAPMDSAVLRLPAAKGDADVRAFRDGKVVADHVAYFGGGSRFEVRVGDADDAGRYRRTRRR